MERELSTYLNLCTQVYDLSKPTPPADAYALYCSYAFEAAGPILEPMCGTGRFLLPLLERGFDVRGFDASSHMLQALHAKAKALNLEPMVWQGFVEDLHQPERYVLILIPSGSFGLIVDRRKAKDALVRLHDHLSDDGALVFEAQTLESASDQTGIWRGSVWPRDDGRLIIANSLDLPLQDDVSRTIWRYELLDGNQIISTEMEEIMVRLYDPATLIPMLKEAGFRSAKTIKAFDETRSPDGDDEMIVYECRK